MLDIKGDVDKDGKWQTIDSSTGDTLIFDSTHTQVLVVDGKDSHEKAKEIAATLIDEDGTVTYYDEEKPYTRTR